MSEIQPFANDEFSLDLIPDGDSFNVIASSVGRPLGFRDAWRLTQSIPKGEKGYTIASTPSGEQRVLVVTEPGFYRALGQRQTARIPDPTIRASVERFQSWVYGDVLPSLRRASTQTPTAPLKIDATVTALAALAHREHVVPTAGRILAHERWHNTPKGVQAFAQLTIDLGIGRATVTAFLPPPRSIVWVKPAPNGVEVLCDCATITVLDLSDVPAGALPLERAFTLVAVSGGVS